MKLIISVVVFIPGAKDLTTILIYYFTLDAEFIFSCPECAFVVKSARNNQFALSVRHVVPELSFVDLARLLKRQFTRAAALAMDELALIAIAVLHRFSDLTVRLIRLPLALNDPAAARHSEFAFSCSLPLVEPTFINVAVRVCMLALAMRRSILEIAFVGRANHRL